MKGFRIQRDLPIGRYPFEAVAEGIAQAVPLVEHFGRSETLARFLTTVQVEVEDFEGFMWVDPEKGCLMISRDYLRDAEAVDLYLDLVHEVVHLRQLADGKELFDRRFPYDQRPTELEAYRVTVAEARRLGLSDGYLCEYLRVPWIDEAQYQRMLAALGVESTPPDSATA